MRNEILIFCTLFIFSTLAYSAEQPVLTHGLTLLKTPVQAPDLRFTNLDDEIIDIKDLKGKTVLVNFWATWCPPCRREMSSLEHFYQQLKDDNVVVLAVNIGEDEDTVFSFLGEVEPIPTYPILFDSDAQSMKAWAVRGLPTTYIVNKQGLVVYRAIGGREFDHPELIAKVKTLANKR